MTKALQTNLLGTLIGCVLISSISLWLIYVVQAGNTAMAYISCFLAGVLIIWLGLTNRFPLINKTTYFLVFLVCIGGLTMAFFLEKVWQSEQRIRSEITVVRSVDKLNQYALSEYFTFREPYKFLPEKSTFTQQEDLYFFLIPVVPVNWQPSQEITLFTSFKVRKPHQIVDWRKTQTEYLKNLTATGTVARLLKNEEDLHFSDKALHDYEWHTSQKPYLVEMGEVKHPIGYDNGLKAGFLLLNGIWLVVSLFYLRFYIKNKQD
jgi:hypothetical protein